MPSEPSAANREFDNILNQLPAQERATLDAARQQVSHFPTQGQTIANDQSALLPVGATPSQAGKDLVHKYGRESPAPSLERERSPEPDR